MNGLQHLSPILPNIVIANQFGHREDAELLEEDSIEIQAPNVGFPKFSLIRGFLREQEIARNADFSPDFVLAVPLIAIAIFFIGLIRAVTSATFSSISIGQYLLLSVPLSQW